MCRKPVVWCWWGPIAREKRCAADRPRSTGEGGRVERVGALYLLWWGITREWHESRPLTLWRAIRATCRLLSLVAPHHSTNWAQKQ